MGSRPVGISASRGAAILGLSEWQSTFEVWQRIHEDREPGWNAAHGMTPPPEPDSAALRWGTAFEDAVVELASAQQAAEIVDREKFFRRDDFITAHVDGVYRAYPELREKPPEPRPHGYTLHEGKTTTAWSFREKWGEPGTDRVPQIYQIQTQHQMLCTGAETDIVSVLVFPDSPDNWEKMGLSVGLEGSTWYIWENAKGNVANACYLPTDWAAVFAQIGNFHQYIVTADRDLQKMLVEAYTDFWRVHIIEGKEPVIDKYADIRRAFPEPVGTLVVPAKIERWITEHKQIGEEIGTSGALAKRRDQLKVMILDWARGQDPTIDDESKDKVVFRSEKGEKLAQFNGKAFR